MVLCWCALPGCPTEEAKTAVDVWPCLTMLSEMNFELALAGRSAAGQGILMLCCLLESTGDGPESAIPPNDWLTADCLLSAGLMFPANWRVS